MGVEPAPLRGGRFFLRFVEPPQRVEINIPLVRGAWPLADGTPHRGILYFPPFVVGVQAFTRGLIHELTLK